MKSYLEDLNDYASAIADGNSGQEPNGRSRGAPRYATVPRGKRFAEFESMQSLGFSALTLESVPRKPTTWNFTREKRVNEEGEACNPYEITTRDDYFSE
ncbi:hypothetical protein N7540_002313 [Penicillium herquei]|nr:hypothetical protein N7540_002313 [Penicillium herquei]